MKEDIEEEEDEDLMGSVWLPVFVDSAGNASSSGGTKKEKSEAKNNNSEKKNGELQDPNVKEIDLAQISEKEVFVRKADLVNTTLS